jgi:hypothetical protein
VLAPGGLLAFGLAAGLTLVAGWLPMRLAVRRLEQLEA